LNQLYSAYGQYDGSSIFGQFGSRFFFRNDEQAIAKMISDMCGSELLSRQQANISFGANEYRDGQSYTTQEKRQKLVEYSDISSLGIGECFVLLPEPAVRLSKLQTPEAKLQEMHEGFMQKEITKGEDKTEATDKIVAAEDGESSAPQSGSSSSEEEKSEGGGSSSGSSGGSGLPGSGTTILNYCLEKPEEMGENALTELPLDSLPKVENNNELKKPPKILTPKTELEIGI